MYTMSANDNNSANDADSEPTIEQRLDACTARVERLIKRNKVLLDEIES